MHPTYSMKKTDHNSQHYFFSNLFHDGDYHYRDVKKNALKQVRQFLSTIEYHSILTWSSMRTFNMMMIFVRIR